MGNRPRCLGAEAGVTPRIGFGVGLLELELEEEEEEGARELHTPLPHDPPHSEACALSRGEMLYS